MPLALFGFPSLVFTSVPLILIIHWSPDVPGVSPTRALFFIRSRPIPPLPHHYIQSLSVSHPSPQSHSLRQGASCERDLSELNYTLHPTNYLSDRSQVSLHCCASRLDLSIRPLFCEAFIIFTQPCALSFINVNTHHSLINC